MERDQNREYEESTRTIKGTLTGCLGAGILWLLIVGYLVSVFGPFTWR